ncbi:hypothetical protein WICMUC_005763 [Wickerhamomyces mucosus]|uniref:Bud site selection protein RAX2 n=1 Tax=Wickerhamomyces mucosus TaxID=1378264 RepID=A0A9P8P2I8_9ASCO|nr:hypothetical protein WICMUC_005763 [Wickerhamomyces mucosus]
MLSTVGVLLGTMFLPHYLLAAQSIISEIDLPDLDFSSFNDNQIGFLGEFDAISIYKYLGESNFTNQNYLQNNLYYTSGTDKQFKTFGEVNGTITEMIQINDELLLLLGDFSKIGEIEVLSPAFFNQTSESFSSLDLNNNITGSVSTAFYDEDETLIYLGGDFTFNKTHGSAIYSMKNHQLNSTVFEGFGSSSKVNTILKLNSRIVFGGKFSTLGLPGLLSQTSNVSNTSIETDQLVSLRHASFSSSNDASVPDFTLSCSTDTNLWSIDDSSSGTFNIELPFTIYPSKIRVYNAIEEQEQISLFRILTSPANGIMNLSYVDPNTNELSYCDAWCPLLNSSSLQDQSTEAIKFHDTSLQITSEYQEFGLVNEIEVTGLTFLALDSYGSSIALSEFQIYESDFSTYANNSYNEPSCSDEVDYSKSELIGEWTSSSDGVFLFSTVDASNGIPDVGINFYPNITYPGNYSILLYTPGCLDDDTCSQRGIVNVTVFDNSTNELLESNLIYQTNEEEKYDSVFYGHMESTPRVELSLYSGISNDNSIVVVGEKISVTVVTIDDIEDKNNTVSINGIFEYSPANFTNFDYSNYTGIDYVGNTTLNTLGSKLSRNSNILLGAYNNSLVVAGEFSSNFGNNLFFYDHSSNQTISVDGGLNGKVNDLKTVDDKLLIAGDFWNTTNNSEINYFSSLKNNELGSVALYNGSWFSFGIDSQNSSRISNLTLNSQEYWVFDNDKWDVNGNSWFSDSYALSFNISSAGKLNDNILFLGSLRISDEITNQGIFVNSSSIGTSNITDDTFLSGNINIGLYINESLSIFGGEFTTVSNITNLVIIEDDQESGIDTINWDTNSSVTQLFVYNEILFIGTAGQEESVIVYDLKNKSLASEQPRSLTSLTSSVKITEFGILYDNYLVVAGEYDAVDNSEVDCSGLCYYNLNTSAWESCISDLSGTINTFKFIDDVIVMGGDIKLNDDSYKVLDYNFTENATVSSSFQDFEKGSVKKLLVVDNSTLGRVIVSGDDFVSAFDGTNWINIGADLENSLITDIQLLELEDSNDLNNQSFFNQNQLLFVSGNLSLQPYGYVSAAYFNSTSWEPYLVATKGKDEASVSSIFMNKDISNLYISGASNSISPVSSSSPTPSSESKERKSKKMDRGFIVLISLALSAGTISFLGAVGALFLFSKKSHDYTPIEPRVNETEMLDTVPPEGLLKHI